MTTAGREGRITRHVVRPILLRAGIATEIECRGRMTGTTRRLTLVAVKVDDAWYLLSTYRQTQWARNLRADGCGTMTRKGRTESFRARPRSRAMSATASSPSSTFGRQVPFAGSSIGCPKRPTTRRSRSSPPR